MLPLLTSGTASSRHQVPGSAHGFELPHEGAESLDRCVLQISGPREISAGSLGAARRQLETGRRPAVTKAHVASTRGPRVANDEAFFRQHGFGTRGRIE